MLGAFSDIKQVQTMAAGVDRQKLQYKSLIATANHEQLNILQPLIYEDPIFRAVLDVQKKAEDIPFVPLRSAAFSTACDVKQSEMREQMHGGDLYNAQDRMEFIQKIADKYHGLMIDKIEYMEGVIAEISRWRSKT